MIEFSSFNLKVGDRSQILRSSIVLTVNAILDMNHSIYTYVYLGQ